MYIYQYIYICAKCKKSIKFLSSQLPDLVISFMFFMNVIKDITPLNNFSTAINDWLLVVGYTNSAKSLRI